MVDEFNLYLFYYPQSPSRTILGVGVLGKQCGKTQQHVFFVFFFFLETCSKTEISDTG